MTLRKLQVLCKPATVEEFEIAYTTETNEKKKKEKLMLLVDACINAERMEDVRKGIQVIQGIQMEGGPTKDLLFALACCHLRCGEYDHALVTINNCLEIDGLFWKAVALKEMITTSLAARASSKSRMKRLTYGALTAIGLGAGSAWFWSSPKLKVLRTETFEEWKNAYDIVEKIEKRMLQDMVMGACVGAGSVAILVVGYFALLGRRIF